LFRFQSAKFLRPASLDHWARFLVPCPSRHASDVFHAKVTVPGIFTAAVFSFYQNSRYQTLNPYASILGFEQKKKRFPKFEKPYIYILSLPVFLLYN